MNAADPGGPLRILIDARFYRRATGGVGRYTRGLIAGLQAVGSEHDFTVLLRPADAAEWPQPTPPGWHTVVWDLPHYSLAEQTRLPAWLARERFNLVHFTMFNHPLAWRGRFVVTIHDLTMTLCPPHPPWHPRSLAYHGVMAHAARAARGVIVPSESTRRDAERLLGVPPERLTVTPEAADAVFRLVDDPARQTALRQRYGLGQRFIVSVNAWRPHKGLEDLVTAFESLAGDGLQLLLAGEPNPAYPAVATAVRATQARCPAILTPGFVADEDLVHLYAMAQAAVFASHYEGFGLGPLEALACGCPTLAADNSSLPEVVGEAGALYPSGDPAALAAGLAELLASPQRLAQMKLAGPQRAGQFSFERMARQTLAVYAAALA